MVIRGKSASGKSSVAQSLRDHYGRGIATVGQDVIRRNVLREHDTARGTNIALGTIAHAALDAGFHVVLEGILYADRYGRTITSLVRDHRGVSGCCKLDVLLGGLESVIPADSTLQDTVARIVRDTDPTAPTARRPP